MGRMASLLRQLRSYLFGGGGSNAWTGVTALDYVPPRRQESGGPQVRVTADSAMRHSAVWACLRLRADMMSMMPLDVFRRIDGIQIEMPKPPILVMPGGDRVDICEWMYSTQVDLDRGGNVFGLITERNGAGLPARIDLQPLSLCSVRERDGVLKYKIDQKEYTPDQVWHERQFTVAGWPVGLSPVAYAAWSIGGSLSAQQFGLEFFNGGHPNGTLRHTVLDTIPQATMDEAKAKFKAAVENRDVFVTGRDWEWTPGAADAAQLAFLDERKFSVGDVARFFGCPGDLIDAAVATGSITYANITQRNLQFLILNLGPAVNRRELALSRLLPAPRYVKLNTAALLRLDPETQANVLGQQIDKRMLTPDEGRELYNRPPLTEAQIEQFERLFTQRRITETIAPAELESLVTDPNAPSMDPSTEPATK